MNKDIIVGVKDISDIKKVNSNTKYINLSIDNAKGDVIDYFLLHGQDYSYGDLLNNRNGFIYASYDMFKKSEETLDNIVDNMPVNLTEIEKIRYIYISLGKVLSSDINISSDKNDMIDFANISVVNNIWGALSIGKATDISICKLFIYLCSKIGIKSELISSNISGHPANKVYTKDSFLVVDLSSDMYNIQGNFITHYFDKYNNDINLDRKIGYIDKEYTNDIIDKLLRDNIDKDNILYRILTLTENIFDINKIGVVELSKIYRDIFDKYCPNYDIKINNFFINERGDRKEHFIVIEYDNELYSYNYSKSHFISISYDYIMNNIKSKKIGLYNGEVFGYEERRVVL